MTATSVVPLPKQAIEEDHRLERAASGASLALMKHRWHWTLDEGNERRVAIRQYARDVGKGETVIRDYARAYDLARSGTRTPGEALERAHMGTETHEAFEAVARARNVTVPAVRQNPRYREEVRQVRAVARERAEAKGTSTAEESRKAAEWTVKTDKAAKREQEERRKHFGSQYLKADGKFIDAARKIAEALDALEGAELDREEWELLSHTIDKVIELAHLAKAARRKSGDWSKKFEVLRGGLSA